MNGGRGTYKARKTPTKIYPSTPPKLQPGVESFYQAVAEELLEEQERTFKDRVVTSQILYKPALLGSARINFHGNRWQIHFEKEMHRVVPFPAKHQICDWNTNLVPNWKNQNAREDPEPESRYDYDGTYDFSRERIAELQEEFQRHLLSTVVLPVEYNPHLRIERKLDESDESFQSRCMEAARTEFTKESHTLEGSIHRLQDRLKQKLDRETRRMENDDQEEGDQHDSSLVIEDLKKEMAKLQILRETKFGELEERLSIIAREREKDALRLNPGNLSMLRFALIWLPYTEYVIQEESSRRLHIVPSF